jgi:hypothetical protein
MRLCLMLASIFIITLGSIACKKVRRNHDINNTWKFHYVDNAGSQQWAPSTIIQIKITFERKGFFGQMPVNDS